MAEETNVLMGMATVLRPYWYFEYWYDRTTSDPRPGYYPIPLMPVNPQIPALANPPNQDPYAFDIAARNNQAGYSPQLAAMMPCPMPGSDVAAWIPQIPTIATEVPTNYCYMFVPIWRLRTPADWRNYKKQGQVRRESFGAPDTTLLFAGQRYILPAGTGNATLSGQQLSQSAGGEIPAWIQPSTNLREGICMPADRDSAIVAPPFGPNGSGLDYQQGILDPIGTEQREFGSPMYRPFWMKTAGNELGFLVYKIESLQPGDDTITYRDWDFDYNPATGYCSELAEDCYFSAIFGLGANADGYRGRYPNSGVFVMAGTTT